MDLAISWDWKINLKTSLYTWGWLVATGVNGAALGAAYIPVPWNVWDTSSELGCVKRCDINILESQFVLQKMGTVVVVPVL